MRGRYCMKARSSFIMAPAVAAVLKKCCSVALLKRCCIRVPVVRWSCLGRDWRVAIALCNPASFVPPPREDPLPERAVLRKNCAAARERAVLRENWLPSGIATKSTCSPDPFARPPLFCATLSRTWKVATKKGGWRKHAMCAKSCFCGEKKYHAAYY